MNQPLSARAIGSAPFGPALATVPRGFRASAYAPAGARLFVDSVRDPQKKEVMEGVEADFRAQLSATGTRILETPVSARRVADHLQRSGVPIVLVSLWRLHGERGPHWVVRTGFDGAVFQWTTTPLNSPRRRKAKACR